MLAVLLLPTSAYSQSYKKLRVGAGLGITDISATGAGVLFHVEPSVRVNDQIAVGLRIETNFRHGNLPVLGSYSLNGQYYFRTKEKVRFFGGLGAGVYSTNTTPIGSCTCESGPTETVVGVYPRFGFDDGHFTLQIEYNFVPAMTNQFTQSIPSTTPPQYEKVSMNYFAFKFGFFIGGGRKSVRSSK